MNYLGKTLIGVFFPKKIFDRLGVPWYNSWKSERKIREW
jgi:hypothetical protein